MTDKHATQVVEDALGFPDMLVCAVAMRILDEELPRDVALRELGRHTDSAEEIYTALFQVSTNVRRDSDSSSESDDGEPVAAPWLWKQAEQGKELHHEVSSFASWIGPDDSEMEVRDCVQKAVERALQRVCPGSCVDRYGSSSTGLDVFHSDLDLAVQPKLPLTEMASALEQELEPGGSPAFCDVEVIRARVPIVTAEHCQSGLSIDLSIGFSTNEEDSSALMSRVAHQHPQFIPLALVLKAFISDKGLHEVYHGGLGSFRLYMLVNSWLSTQARPNDLGACLIQLLADFSHDIPAQVTVEGVTADLSGVRLADCQEAFREAAGKLQRSHSLGSVLAVKVLIRMRHKCQQSAAAYLERERQRVASPGHKGDKGEKKRKREEFAPRY
eukprot:TRINITY_DN2366_c0_g1_i1.p1 TRINITY_DN2366_c0_g1~~TRINITY_DN2366_c0_g1_i1.p1  ORF type:complete len:386 (-),score=93.81 TRINITY_DN2366_c0_g1_i1:181-1338(-)